MGEPMKANEVVVIRLSRNMKQKVRSHKYGGHREQVVGLGAMKEDMEHE